MVLFSCSRYSHFLVLVACVLLLAVLFEYDECYIEPACVLFALQCPSFLITPTTAQTMLVISCKINKTTQPLPSGMKVTELIIVMDVRIHTYLEHLKCNGLVMVVLNFQN
jgi:hypothetical protein